MIIIRILSILFLILPTSFGFWLFLEGKNFTHKFHLIKLSIFLITVECANKKQFKFDHHEMSNHRENKSEL